MSVIDLEGNMTHFEIQFPLWFTICLLLVLSAALTFAQAPDKVLLSLAESGDVQSITATRSLPITSGRIMQTRSTVKRTGCFRANGRRREGERWGREAA